MNQRAKKRLSFLIASSLMLTNFTLAYADGYYGWDLDNNDIYASNLYYINNETVKISNDNKTVEIKSFTKPNETWSFYGGRGEQEQVEEYTLILNGVRGTLNSKFRAYGGFSVNERANGNAVNIYNDVYDDKNNILTDVYGGLSETKNADFNAVKIEDSEISGNVYGGRSLAQDSNSNTVEIDETTVAKTVYGGHAASEANALDNDVKITKSEAKNIYGGYVNGSDVGTRWGASDETDISQNNTITIVDSSVENIYGGRGKIVSENKIFLNNANVTNNLAGADTVSEIASDNELILLSAGNYAKNILNFETIRFGDENKLSWAKGATVLQAETFAGENVTLDVSNISLPDDFSEENLGEKMILLDITDGVNLSDFIFKNAVFTDANSVDLKKFKTFDIDVNFTPAHSIFAEETTITDTIKGKVNSIVFKNVPWTKTAPLIEKDDNFDYENAAVNTANINFINVDKLNKNEQMILVESFGNTNSIKGDTYKIKTTLEGKGKAKIDENKNLIFIIETEAKKKEPKIETEENTNDDNDDYEEVIEEIKPQKDIKKEEIKPKEEQKEEVKEDEIKEEMIEKEEIVSKNDDAQEITNNETINKEENSPVLKTQEQTHNTVMSMEAAMVALSSAGDFVQTAMEGIADGAKGSADGVSTYAGMGGGSSKTKTGSSVNADAWSAILALGQERKLKTGTFSYGGFFEYGRANYTIEPNNGMSGASKYTGGGVFVKWQNLNNVYFEGSIRAGKMRDSASGILADSLGNSYGYDVSSNYIGAHFGAGKIYKYKNDNELDLYGKFFYTRRGGVSYEAGGFYDLDAVKSKVVKIGGRYGKNKVGWNSFVGVSYAYEFDGVAKGTADGYAIREAKTTGGTLAFELGLRLTPSSTSKWKSDISLKAHTGRSKGYGGNISLAYLFN